MVFLVLLLVSGVFAELNLSLYLSQPELGRNLSRVDGLPYPAASYSGLFTVAPDTQSFFWLFEAENGDAAAPTIVWLQGGPGASSLFGLFAEIGPFSVDASGTTLVPRPNNSWTRFANVLFVDNPPGVGLSTTSRADGFAKSEKQVGQLLLSFINQFYTIFPALLSSPLYIAGESYGGKYAPSFACAILGQGNKTIPLAGISLGDGAWDPPTQFTKVQQGSRDCAGPDLTRVRVLRHCCTRGRWRTAARLR